MVDRGPDPVGCLRKAQELNIECVRGNHEDKAYRWMKHYNKCLISGEKHPMKNINDKTRNEYLSMTEDDLNFIKRMPTAISLDPVNKWIVVHAGVEPRVPFKKQVDNQLMRVRYVDERGYAISLNSDKSQPKGTKYWAELWDNEESFIFGHNVFKEPTFFKRKDSEKYVGVGIDTGCCYGNALTAIRYPSLEVIQVKAKQVYYTK